MVGVVDVADGVIAVIKYVSLSFVFAGGLWLTKV